MHILFFVLLVFLLLFVEHEGRDEETEAGQGEGPRHLGEDRAGDAQGSRGQGRRRPVSSPPPIPPNCHDVKWINPVRVCLL